MITEFLKKAMDPDYWACQLEMEGHEIIDFISWLLYQGQSIPHPLVQAIRDKKKVVWMAHRGILGRAEEQPGDVYIGRLFSRNIIVPEEQYDFIYGIKQPADNNY